MFLVVPVQEIASDEMKKLASVIAEEAGFILGFRAASVS